MSRESWVANHCRKQITPEQIILSKAHMVQIFKSLQGTLWCITSNMQTRYVAASMVTDKQTKYRNPTVHSPRINDNMWFKYSVVGVASSTREHKHNTEWKC